MLRPGLPVGPATQLRYGVAWQRFAFDRSGPMAVPDYLQELALDLGAEWAWSERLGVRLSLGDARNRARPAFYDNRHRRAELSVSAHW